MGYRCKLILALLLFSFITSFAQETTLLDTQAPDIQFEKILNFNQTSARLAEHKGKAVLIDFWATWCAPCLKAFKHLEELQQAFPNDLQVITVSTDSEKRLEQFLKSFKTSLPIVVDEQRKIGEVFPHRTIPHSVLIDKNGIIRVIASPEMITEAVIQKVLQEELVGLAEKKENLTFNPDEPLSGTHNVLFQITLTPYQQGIPSMSTAFVNGRMMMTNLGLRTFYEIAHGFPVYTRTLFEVENPKKYDWSKETAYCLEIIAPDKTKADVLQIMTDYLHQNFALKSKIEKRQVKVKVLRRTSHQLLIPAAEPDAEPAFSYSGNGLKANNVPINALSDFLESELHQPVLEETGLSGKYNLDVPFYNEDPKRIYDELKKIGFELIDAEREIDMLILYEQ